MEGFHAVTQYGDMYGEIAIDGYHGPIHKKLADKTRMPPGFWPIGFSIHGLDVEENGMIPIDLMVIRLEDYEINTTNNIPDQLYAFLAKDTNELVVYPISMKISFEDLKALIKQLSIKVRLRQIPQDIIKVDYDNASIVEIEP